MAKILVVDDAAFMRMRCKKLLSQSGFDVIEAATGAQAVEAYKEGRPDVVLLDITMPDMDGWFDGAERAEEARPGSQDCHGQRHGPAVRSDGSPEVRGPGLPGEALRSRPGSGHRKKDARLIVAVRVPSIPSRWALSRRISGTSWRKKHQYQLAATP